MVNNKNFIYLAGIVDGEGCFNITRCRDTYVPRILITNTNYKLSRWLTRNFGGDICWTKVKNKKNWKPRFLWRLSHQNALDLTKKIHKFLLIKKEQSSVFLVWDAVKAVYSPQERKPFYKILNNRIKDMNKKGIAMSEARRMM